MFSIVFCPCSEDYETLYDIEKVSDIPERVGAFLESLPNKDYELPQGFFILNEVDGTATYKTVEPQPAYFIDWETD